MALNHIHIRKYESTSPPQSAGQEALNQGTLMIMPVLQSKNSAFGAEISGVDWENPIPEETVEQVRDIGSIPNDRWLNSCTASCLTE